MSDSAHLREPKQWRRVVAPYTVPCPRIALWQVLSTLGLYIMLWVAMVMAVRVSYLLVLLLSFPAAGVAVRLFVLAHDCGHGSLFKSKRANRFWGRVCAFLTFTPFARWQHEHGVHHATAGDLDRRGVGDIWTLTVKEYLSLPPRGRAWYRIYRNPVILIGVGGPYLFLIGYRFPRKGSEARDRTSTYTTDLGLLLWWGVMAATIGFGTYVRIQLPIIVLASFAGTWLFYVQHQFEGVVWRRHEEWNYVEQAIYGSSYYRLPKWLQWFSGSIGFHHVHHLGPKIPNYHLEACHHSDPLFAQSQELTLLSSLRCLRYRLWDENQQRLIGFAELPAAGPDAESTD